MTSVISTISLMLLASQAYGALPASCFADQSKGPGNVKIIGGEETLEREFAFQVSLQDFGSHFCGGSLIAPNVVLTAAHCLPVENVVIGAHAINNFSNDPCVETIKVKQNIKHPQYDGFASTNDIALLILEENSEYPTINVEPTVADEAPGNDVTVIGWGVTKENGNIAEKLQKVSLDIISNAQCNQKYGGGITDDMICAGVDYDGKDSCQGDSGGPLFTTDQQGVITQVGVVSWGQGCANKDYPGVYARVSNFETWMCQNAQVACDPNNPAPPLPPTAKPTTVPIGGGDCDGKDDSTFDAGFGGCDTYAPGGGNEGYCGLDTDQNTGKLAQEMCPCACQNSTGGAPEFPPDFPSGEGGEFPFPPDFPSGEGGEFPFPGDCDGKDDSTFDAGFGGCDKYAPGGGNEGYCGLDTDQNTGKLAQEMCPCACQNSTGGTPEFPPDFPSGEGGEFPFPPDFPNGPEPPIEEQCVTVDSQSWDAGFGGCTTYGQYQGNHGYCAADTDSSGKTAMEACACACSTGDGSNATAPPAFPEFPETVPGGEFPETAFPGGVPPYYPPAGETPYTEFPSTTFPGGVPPYYPPTGETPNTTFPGGVPPYYPPGDDYGGNGGFGDFGNTDYGNTDFGNTGDFGNTFGPNDYYGSQEDFYTPNTEFPETTYPGGVPPYYPPAGETPYTEFPATTYPEGVPPYYPPTGETPYTEFPATTYPEGVPPYYPTAGETPYTEFPATTYPGGVPPYYPPGDDYGGNGGFGDFGNTDFGNTDFGNTGDYGNTFGPNNYYGSQEDFYQVQWDQQTTSDASGKRGSVTRCVDSTRFSAGHGGCDTYKVGGNNHDYCSSDTDNYTGTLANVACARACGACGN